RKSAKAIDFASAARALVKRMIEITFERQNKFRRKTRRSADATVWAWANSEAAAVNRRERKSGRGSALNGLNGQANDSARRPLPLYRRQGGAAVYRCLLDVDQVGPRTVVSARL